jgi:hypothetical protein
MEQSKLIGESKRFNEKINSIRSQFFSALDDFKKYYVYFNKNPEVNEFQNYYSNSRAQLQTMSQDLYLTTASINQTIKKLYEDISIISEKLENEKELNKELMELVANLDNTHSGSKILIDDSKRLYNKQYYKNIELVFGMIIIIMLLSALLKKNVANSITK